MWLKICCFVPAVMAFQLIPYPRKSSNLIILKGSSLEIEKHRHHDEKKKNLHSDRDNIHEHENTDPFTFIANQGKTANFMLYWPSLTTFTLVDRWNDTTTKEFKAAVNKVVNQNPILTGRASKTGIFNNVKIMITSGSFPTNSHDFVNDLSLFDYNSSAILPDLSRLNETEILHFMDDNIAPIVPKIDSVIESISNGSPLFGIDLIHLPDGYACYVVKMSHCVGDGVCYFKIVEQINHYFNNHKKKKHKDDIEWTNEAISTHEVFPARFSPRDAQTMYGFPFILGLLRNFYNIRKQKKGYFLLSKKKIQEKKKEFISLHNTNVSTNDIITTALCEANMATDIFAFTMNMRSLHCHYGGNFHNEVPFPKKAILSNSQKSATLHNTRSHSNPKAFREILKRGFYYDTDEIPVCPFILGTVGRISSLATIQKLILKDKEMKVVCHAVLSSFVTNVPMDTAFISSMNEECFVVLHNFRELDENGLLDKILL